MTRETHTLEDVIGRYLANQATDDETAWLAAKLGESSEDLDVMVDALLVEAGLIELGEDGGLVSIRPHTTPWWRRPGWVSLGSAAAIVAIAAWILAQFIAPTPEPFAQWTASPGGLVSVTSAGETVGELKPGSTLRVNQGCAEVVLASGVRCLVQAPATLHLDTDSRVRLKDGVGRFHIEPEAHGFEVLTDDLRVIDLGTEFGIDARGEHRAEVHVIEGAVQVTTLSGRRESMRVDAGHAVALGLIGTLESTLIKPERFLASLPAGIPALHFNFDTPENGNFVARGLIARRDGVHLSIDNLGTARPIPSESGNVLRFNGDGFVATNWPGIGGTNPRTIAFRIRLDPDPDPQPRAAAILGWGNFHNAHTMSDFGLRTSGPSGQLRIVSGRRWLQSEAIIADGQWHHVAIVLSEHRVGSWPQMQLYINGHDDPLMPGEPWREPSAPIDTFSTEIHHPHSQPLTLGRFILNSEKTYLADLRGEIDDLIIAEGALNAEQIQALHEGRLEDSGLDVF